MTSSIGLVLGAGGMSGQAYHAGALAALAHDTGWDPRTADVVVGTSAGAVTGALLRGGVGADDLAAYGVQAPLSAAMTRVAEAVDGHAALTPLRWYQVLRPGRFPGPGLLLALARHPERFMTALLALTHAADADVEEQLDFLDSLLPAWPVDDLRVCAVRRRDGHRVVFRDGRQSPRRAVAASCAVPGYFAPVEIAGVEYIDGGAHTPTNADVLAPHDVEVVVVVSPMSASGSWGAGVDGLVRRTAGAWLAREVSLLRAAGKHVLVVEPGVDVRAVMGDDPMSVEVAPDVVREAFLDTGRQLHAGEPEVLTALRAASTRAA
jgi:NTE family protein